MAALPGPDPVVSDVRKALSAALGDAAGTFAAALDDVAGTMDKHGTSAWISSVGVLLIGFGLATREGHWSHLRSGEFIAVLAVGLMFVVIGVGYRLYARIAADAALREGLKAEVDAAREQTQTVTAMANAAPRG